MKLRLWPGISLAIVMLLLRVVAPRVMTEGALVGTLGFTAGGVIIFLWWLFFSRAPWLERLGVLAAIALATYISFFTVHPSIRGGAMGMLLPMFLAIPGFSLALVAALVISRHSSEATRRVAIVAAIVIAS